MNNQRQMDRAEARWPKLAEAFHVPLEDVAQELEANLKEGLREEAVTQARVKFGPNQLAAAPPIPWWRRLLGQFQDLVIWILIAAAVISGLMGDLTDSIAIMAIVVLNGLIGFFQQERAEQAIAALRKLSAPGAKVLREGRLQAVPAVELVPGDVIEIEAGDNIPADARLIEAFALQIQEASLTGESTPVSKDAHAQLAEKAALGDRANMLYMGTVASNGKGRALVVAIGMQTELGRIAGLLEQEPAEVTPLQRRLAELGRVLVWVCLAMVAVVFSLQMARGGDLMEIFLVSVSLAVAAVPEGLPAVVTLALAFGLQRMAKRNALVRKLPSVETLGSVTVICSDKTGTLTRNEMTVRTLIAGNVEYRVTGTGYGPEGQFFVATQGGVETSGQPVQLDEARTPDVHRLLTIGARCNNAKLVGTPGQTDGWQVLGDPTEGAILVAARKAGIEHDADGSRFVSEIPFDSQRKAMSVIYREADGSLVMYSKGAPEVIASLCTQELQEGTPHPFTEERRAAVLEESTRLAKGALRVLGLAFRTGERVNAGEFVERDLVFVGLCGMIDPPREEAKQAVTSARNAGIRPVMITGDHPGTARAIALELGILAAQGEVVTGKELEAASDEQLAERVKHISVYARVSAEHKLRVVHALKKQGELVAMTGDGVNDAPAVKAADIGIAMGITGTDVTKQASDIVLTDDNFRSIVGAIEEGRSIFENIQNVVRYLLSTNAGEVLFMLFATLADWPVPLAAIQILWINLVTDGLPALALALEPPDRTIMDRPPRPPREPVLTARHGMSIAINGALVAIAAAVGFWLVYQGKTENLHPARTTAFCVLAFSQLFFSFACRSSRYTLLELGVFSNPYLLAAIVVSGLLQVGVVMLPGVREILEVSSSPTSGWILILGLALIPVSVVELAKIVMSVQRGRRPGP